MNVMKVGSYILLLFISVGAFAQSSWKSPSYVKETYRKIIVLAKTTDNLMQRQLEDATVAALNEKGVAALPAYGNIVAADLANETAFLAKADALAVDALLVLTPNGEEVTYKSTPSVNMSLGVPVRLGIFGGFLGTNVPIAGGTKAAVSVTMKATFYNRASSQMQWSKNVQAKQKKNNDKMVNGMVGSIVGALFKEAIL